MIPTITHTFFDFEVEEVGNDLQQNETHLVKILSVDGRRFTYEVHGVLNDEAIAYIKSLLDAVVFSDLIVEKTSEGYEAREATARLKKHS
jgi:hypothetical protein